MIKNRSWLNLSTELAKNKKKGAFFCSLKIYTGMKLKNCAKKYIFYKRKLQKSRGS
jgi:hypothetical protein